MSGAPSDQDGIRRFLVLFSLLWGGGATALAQWIYWTELRNELADADILIFALCFVAPACAFLAALAALSGRLAGAGVLLLLSSTSMSGYLYPGNALAFLTALLTLFYAGLRAARNGRVKT